MQSNRQEAAHSQRVQGRDQDETQILAWWQQYPNAMIGAPMGPASNLWAVDLDLDPARKIDGKATLDQLVTQRGALPPTWATITPRGGRHLIFAWDANVDIRNSAGKIGPGIDVRGNGGYVCLPPSRNATGGAYQWEPGGPQNAALAPPWLVALAKAKKTSAYVRAALEGECKKVAAALPGTRNSTLNTAAFNLGQLVGGGALDEQDVRDRLFEAAETCRLVADDGAPTVATIDSGITAGKKQPRSRPQPHRRYAPHHPARGWRTASHPHGNRGCAARIGICRSFRAREGWSSPSPRAWPRRTAARPRLRACASSHRKAFWPRLPRALYFRNGTASVRAGRHRSAAALCARPARDRATLAASARHRHYHHTNAAPGWLAAR